MSINFVIRFLFHFVCISINDHILQVTFNILDRLTTIINERPFVVFTSMGMLTSANIQSGKAQELLSFSITSLRPVSFPSSVAIYFELISVRHHSFSDRPYISSILTLTFGYLPFLSLLFFLSSRSIKDIHPVKERKLYDLLVNRLYIRKTF